MTTLKQNILFSFSFILFAFTANAQQINIGKIDSIYSKTLGENRKLWIHLPQNALNNLNSKERYPVVYLLDGDTHFSSVVGMIEQLSSVNGNTICPEMIVVGIPNTDRTRDLTPSHVGLNLLDPTSSQLGNSGGGDKFIEFIEKEVFPYVNANYPAAPYKMLIGHSLGGLMAMDVAMNHTNMFNAYLAIDPSMWWDNKKLLKSITQSLPTKKLDNVSLYLACANTMPEGMDINKVFKDSTKITDHIRAILETDKLLKKTKKTNLKYKFKYYNDDNHGSVPLIAEYDALHFIFDFYTLKLTTEDRTNTTKAVVDKIENHYTNLSKNFGYTVSMPEGITNNLGYQLLAKQDYDLAEYVFQRNINNYPTSSNVYDSMGDCNLAKGEKDKAIINFKKALSLDNSVIETRTKLEALLKE